jgi:hypothetical protein
MTAEDHDAPIPEGYKDLLESTALVHVAPMASRRTLPYGSIGMANTSSSARPRLARSTAT